MRVYNDELYHWGIKGMKWGVRRYQKSDGTLTSEGLKRYGRLKNENQQKTSGRLQKHTKSKKHTAINAYEAERRRQRRYLSAKHAVFVGQSMVNRYLQDHNVTLNGNPLRMNPAAMAAVNTILNLKYMKDTFK